MIVPDAAYVITPLTKDEMTKDNTTNFSASTLTSTSSFTSTCRFGWARTTAPSQLLAIVVHAIAQGASTSPVL